MKQENRTNEQKERTRYVPAGIVVVNISTGNVLCQSGNDSPTEEDWGDGGFGLGGKN